MPGLERPATTAGRHRLARLVTRVDFCEVFELTISEMAESLSTSRRSIERGQKSLREVERVKSLARLFGASGGFLANPHLWPARPVPFGSAR